MSDLIGHCLGIIFDGILTQCVTTRRAFNQIICGCNCSDAPCCSAEDVWPGDGGDPDDGEDEQPEVGERRPLLGQAKTNGNGSAPVDVPPKERERMKVRRMSEASGAGMGAEGARVEGGAGLDRQQLAHCIALLEGGADPDALATVIRDLRSEARKRP
ncbi:hypothetical protein MNV49_004280 [Pseudohyphozyma bogoriensis]|nr:hypothetical protein MNV49_004280 [Pseudohyphozyma bogoriensis]